MEKILITGHEAEMAAIAAKRQGGTEAEARHTAASYLRAAVEVLGGEGPSLRAKLFGEQDPPKWREDSARSYMAKALKALAKVR